MQGPVRQLARRSINQLAEKRPTPSTSVLPCVCPHRPLSTSVLPFPHPSDVQSKQRASSWAALSLAGQSLFTPRDSPKTSSSSSPVLSETAQLLVAELQLRHPDPHRAWSLFSRLDIQGGTHTLPPISLHSLLAALYTPPNRSRLDVHGSTTRARSFGAKVDLVRLRIQQAGGTTTIGDLLACLKQYAALKYAPGVCKIWDEMLEFGWSPSTTLCATTFEAMEGWVQMHEKAGGKAVARVAAEPLVGKAAAMLLEIEGDAKKKEAVLESFFRIVLKARDRRVFTVAMRTVYGFDVELPGAEVDASENVRAGMRTMGEEQVCWVLEMLAETKDLSGMMAVFEVFDSPSLPTSAGEEPTFFGRSFSTSTSSLSTSTPLPSTPSPPPLHLIGTRAFSLIIHAASEFDHGAVARHYFNQLFWRWQVGADERLSSIEQAVGVEYVGEEKHLDEKLERGHSLHSRAFSPFSLLSSKLTSFAPSDSYSTLSPALSPIPAPAKDYYIPSTLVHDLTRHARAHYDAGTARYIRRRTLRILQLMGQHTNRITAVLDHLESALSPSPTTPIKSLGVLAREVSFQSYHRLQLRLIFDHIKAESNVVGAYAHLRHLLSALSSRIKRLQAANGDRVKVLKLRPGVKRKEHQVLLGRMLVARQRLARLQKMGKATPGKEEYDHWVGVLAGLKAKIGKEEGMAAIEGVEE